jgi:hypothetical protein
MSHKFVEAGRFWSTVLLRLGAVGITMPWRTIYYLPLSRDAEFERHELTHIRQIEHYGACRFSIMYLHWCWRYGYYWNPFEVAARVASGETKVLPEYHSHPVLGPVLAASLEPLRADTETP